MKVLRLGLVLLAAAAAGCGGGGDGGGTTQPPPPNNNQTLGSIATSVSSLALTAGQSSGITVIAYDTQNAVISNPGTPSFSSQNLTIAEVDASGNVLAIGAGTTSVVASLTRGGITKQATVSVSVSGSLPLNANVAAAEAAYGFTPSVVAVQRGGSVSWTFGPLEHTVTFGQTTGAPTSISSGGYSTTVSRTFNTSGNFNYICSIHAGMTGQVVVR